MGKPGKSRVKFKRPVGAGVPDALRAAAASAAGSSRDAEPTLPTPAVDEEEEEEDVPGINFVPCATWVPRGVCKAIPDKVELTKEELKRVIDETRRNLRDLEDEEAEDDGEGGERAGVSSSRDAGGDDDGDIEAKYGFDDYDEEGGGDFGLGDMVEFGDNADDPLFKEPRGGDSDSEGEDFEIKPTDNLIVTGHWEDHSSILEVHVYNSEEGNLFVHHDILLPACPLALEWIDCGRSGGKGNFVAVGSMDPVIQVWDLDVVNCLEPCAKLGERISKKKKKKGGAGAPLPAGHMDAVLDMSWNRLNKQTLASGSVDQTTILWDFQRGKPSKTLRHFEEKVQSVLWHPTEVSWLLTGCGDGKARLFDARDESKAQNVWKCGSSVEKVLWDPSSKNCFFAGTEDGFLNCYDVRQKQKLWRIQAVTEPLSDVAVSTSCPGLVTASEDGEVQIWDTQCSSSEAGEPSLIARRDMGVGKIMFVRFCPDEPFVVCAGGDYRPNTFSVWDLRNTPGVVERFSSKVEGSSSGGAEPMEEDS